VREKFIIK